jgi:predicted dehydrogenase
MKEQQTGVHMLARPSETGGRWRGLGVAVVGCGYWGAKHVRVLSGLPDVGKVVVIDPDPVARARIQTAFPAAGTFPDLAAALPHVDAVVVATPPESHFDVTLLALRSGKHVLVEKPLTTSLSQARILVGEARRANRILMVGHTFLFVPAVRELKRRLDQNELGKIQYIHSARLNLGLYRSDVNVIWDLAPHDITVMNYLLGSIPTAVSAWGASLACESVEDVAYIRLDYRQVGVSGYCHLSWLDPRKERTVTVVGRQKMAVYDDLADERLRIYDCGVRSQHPNEPSHERPTSYRYGDIVSPHIQPDEPLAAEDGHFLDCIRRCAVPEAPGIDGLIIVAILEAIDRSLARKAAVEIEYPPEIHEDVPTSRSLLVG